MMGLQTASTSFCFSLNSSTGKLVGVQPLDGLVALVVDGLAVVIRDLVLHLLILDGGLHVEAVALQAILGGNPLFLLPGGLVSSGHVEETVGVNVEGDLNLGNSSGGWRNSGQIELAKVVVVLGHGPLTLVHLDGDSRLVVGVGGEG